MVVGTSCFGIAVHSRSCSGATSLTCPLLHANPRQIKRTSGLQKAKRIVLTIAQLVDYLVVRPFISVSLQLRPRPKHKHLLFTQVPEQKFSVRTAPRPRRHRPPPLPRHSFPGQKPAPPPPGSAPPFPRQPTPNHPRTEAGSLRTQQLLSRRGCVARRCYTIDLPRISSAVISCPTYIEPTLADAWLSKPSFTTPGCRAR